MEMKKEFRTPLNNINLRQELFKMEQDYDTIKKNLFNYEKDYENTISNINEHSHAKHNNNIKYIKELYKNIFILILNFLGILFLKI